VLVLNPKVFNFIFTKKLLMQPEILEHLKKNPIQNLPVIGFFENYPLEKHLVYGKSMILKGSSDYAWAYLSVIDDEELEILLEKFEYESLYFANVEEWMLPFLTLSHRVEWKLATHRYYLPENVEVAPSQHQCTLLSDSMVGYIFQHSPYKDFTSEAYIKQRLERDISAGIWVDDKLVGWGLTHDDGSLGFLNVLSGFRGQGMGEAVFRSLINAKRERDKPVFVNVEPHNKQSVNLLSKLGFRYDRPVSWVKLV
jgi:ribosomal protein S18 acetylase RimI-like enzyme